jgi:O-antigen ligase
LRTAIWVLWAAVLLAIPWVRIDIVGRITLTEMLFTVLVLLLAVDAALRRPWAHWHRAQWVYVGVIAVWVLTVAMSGIHARYVSAYVDELLAVVYLGALSVVTLLIAGEEERSFDQTLLWAGRAASVVLVVSLVGFLIKMISDQNLLLLYSSAVKLTATFDNPNQLASYLVVILPIAWERLWSSRGWARAGYIAACLAAGVAILASFSRAGIACAAIIALGYCVWALARRHHRQVVALLATGGVVVGLVYLSYFLTLQYQLRDFVPGMKSFFRILDAVRSEGVITDSFRVENWGLALELFRLHPVTGYGLANVWHDYGYEIHNTYLAVLAEAGVVGAVGFSLVWGLTTFLGFRNTWLASRLKPSWSPYARGLFVGWLATSVFAIQHILYRARHVWLLVGLIIAMSVILQNLSRREEKHVRDLRNP